MWVDLDPVAASEFIAKLPVSRDRNKVVEILADRIESFDPEGASKWRESLRNAKEPN
jgi:hypothetical protein